MKNKLYLINWIIAKITIKQEKVEYLKNNTNVTNKKLIKLKIERIKHDIKELKEIKEILENEN